MAPTPRSGRFLQTWVDFDPRFDTPRSPGHCPIAHALKESDPDIVRVRVKLDTISFAYTSNRTRYVFQTPQPAMQFIIDVDGGRPAQSFMLTLREDDLMRKYYLGPPLKQTVIHHDGRGSGPRGPQLRPIVVVT